MGMVLKLRPPRNAEDALEESVLEMLDSGKMFSATLVLVDADGRDYRIPITKSCDLVQALFQPDAPSLFLSRLLQKTTF
jgi:hypothetical protein